MLGITAQHDVPFLDPGPVPLADFPSSQTPVTEICFDLVLLLRVYVKVRQFTCACEVHWYQYSRAFFSVGHFAVGALELLVCLLRFF